MNMYVPVLVKKISFLSHTCQKSMIWFLKHKAFVNLNYKKSLLKMTKLFGLFRAFLKSFHICETHRFHHMPTWQ
jgi:hypothetical protein